MANPITSRKGKRRVQGHAQVMGRPRMRTQVSESHPCLVHCARWPRSQATGGRCYRTSKRSKDNDKQVSQEDNRGRWRWHFEGGALKPGFEPGVN